MSVVKSSAYATYNARLKRSASSETYVFPSFFRYSGSHKSRGEGVRNDRTFIMCEESEVSCIHGESGGTKV